MLLKQATLLHLKWSTSTKEDTLACKHTLPPNIPSCLLLKQNKANKQQQQQNSKYLEGTIGKHDEVSAACSHKPA